MTMPARPKYQVFISSTYSDLREEREAVTWTILTARHIPVGMEAFTATDDRGWQTIKSVIDRSDYYVLLLAGRYGSTDKDGQSWTEKEYEYAVSKGIPILVFVRSKGSITADLLDDDPLLTKKLGEFRGRVRNSHLCVEWKEKEDLIAHVSGALRNQIIDDEDSGKSRPGWYRGDELPKTATLDEFARLSSETERLRSELDSMRTAMEDAPSLSLVERKQTPVAGHCKTTRVFKIYHPSLTTLEETDKESFGAEYLALNTITIFELGVQNISRSLVEHVVLDLTLAEIKGFKCGWTANELEGREGRLSNNTIKSEYKIEYPEAVRLDGFDQASFRFRVERISAGATEYIPILLVVGAVKHDCSYFTLKYSIAGSVGGAVSGQCDYEIEFNDAEKISKEGYEADKRALRKYSEFLILNDMFFKRDRR